MTINTAIKSRNIRWQRALAIVALLALPAVAGAAPVAVEGAERPSERTTVDVERQIQRVLDSRLRTNVFDWVEAEIDGDKVILHGAVNLPATLSRIAKRIEKIPGVATVERQVELLPVSGFDDRLRAQAFRLIYGNITYSQYPALGRTPIHIIVDRGQVTLVGSVATRVEARLAEALVRADTLAFKVHNQIQTRSDARRRSVKTAPTA